MAGLLFGPGSITEAQLVAFSAAGLVVLFLLSANVAVWRLYRRASSEDTRQAKRERKKRMSDVWVYHVNRRPSISANNNINNAAAAAAAKRLSPSQQILNKLRASHENLKLTLAASEAGRERGTLGQDEHQALEELDVMADLFLHDRSNASSRRSSLGSEISLPRDDDDGGGGGGFLPLGTFGGFSSGAVEDDIRELDKVSTSSVTMADFANDDPGDGGRRRGGRRKRSSARRTSSRRSRDDAGDQPLPVAEFHNEAFDFAEPSYAAVERVQDIEL